MMVKTKKISLSTKGQVDVINISEKIAATLKDTEIKNGIVTIFIPGATAGITTVEFEPGLVKDIKEFYKTLFPYNKSYHHHETWGCDNGSSHMQAQLLKPSLTIPFNDRTMFLGAWQQIVLVEFDTKPREREIICQIVGQ